MKKLVLSLLIIIPIVVSGQDFNKIYFNKHWVGTSIDNTVFYRISGFNNTIPAYDGKTVDSYFGTDNIQMVGYYENGKRNGEFKFYFPNGNEQLIINYKNGQRTGTWKEFYENGKIKVELKYLNGKVLLVKWNDTNGNSLIKNNKVDYQIEEYDQPLNILEAREPKLITRRYKGKIINKLREGKRKVYFNGKQNATLLYEDGVLKEGDLQIGQANHKIYNNLAFSLISNPYKLAVTELFMFEEGAVIKPL